MGCPVLFHGSLDLEAMIRYTVIIPHKNSAEALQYCLDSIPAREDVQVIVVDDNSNTEKVDFDHFPQWKGLHYEWYLTKEGKGAGYVRNVGLKYAKGEWVLFADADDFFLPCFSEILDEEKDTDADLVVFRPKAVLLSDRTTESKRADIYKEFVDRFIKTQDETELRCRWFPVWSKLYRRSTIMDHGIRFEEQRYSNDNMFSAQFGVVADKIVLHDKTFYCVTESDHSLTSCFMKKPGELQMRTDTFFRVQQFLAGHGYPVDEKYVFFYLRMLFSEDSDAFFKNFARMEEIDFGRVRLIRELFKVNKPASRLKRSVYVFLKTAFR